MSVVRSVEGDDVQKRRTHAHRRTTRRARRWLETEQPQEFDVLARSVSRKFILEGEVPQLLRKFHRPDHVPIEQYRAHLEKAVRTFMRATHPQVWDGIYAEECADLPPLLRGRKS